MPTHFEGCEGIVRALNAYINLVRASDTVLSKIAVDLESEGVTMGQFAVLEALLHLGPMCQHALAEKLLRSGGNMTLVVDNLQKQGWVKRQRQEKDRRMVEIHLTPKGRRLITRIFPEHAKVIARVMGELTPAEQEDLRRIARKLGRGAEELCAERLKKETYNDSHQTK
jgi:MarR family transcriptional regulator, 2-MHQ and catechol-resistance regulon repressor